MRIRSFAAALAGLALAVPAAAPAHAAEIKVFASNGVKASVASKFCFHNFQFFPFPADCPAIP